MDAFPITLYRAFVVISSRRLSRTVGQRTTERLSAYYFRRPSRTAGQRTTEHLSAHHLAGPAERVGPRYTEHLSAYRYADPIKSLGPFITEPNYRAFVGISLHGPNRTSGPRTTEHLSAYHLAGPRKPRARVIPSICRYMAVDPIKSLGQLITEPYYRAFVGISLRGPHRTSGPRTTEYLSAYHPAGPRKPRAFVTPSICRYIAAWTQSNLRPTYYRVFVGISSRRPRETAGLHYTEHLSAYRLEGPNRAAGQVNAMTSQWLPRLS